MTILLIYFRFIFIVPFLCPNSSDMIEGQVVSKLVQQETVVIFQIYGEAWDYEDLIANDSITKPYGFRLIRLAGCEIEDEEMKQIHQHNKNAYQQMDKNYGVGWQSTFERATNTKFRIPLETN